MSALRTRVFDPVCAFISSSSPSGRFCSTLMILMRIHELFVRIQKGSIQSWSRDMWFHRSLGTTVPSPLLDSASATNRALNSALEQVPMDSTECNRCSRVSSHLAASWFQLWLEMCSDFAMMGCCTVFMWGSIWGCFCFRPQTHSYVFLQVADNSCVAASTRTCGWTATSKTRSPAFIGLRSSWALISDIFPIFLSQSFSSETNHSLQADLDSQPFSGVTFQASDRSAHHEIGNSANLA